MVYNIFWFHFQYPVYNTLWWQIKAHNNVTIPITGTIILALIRIKTVWVLANENIRQFPRCYVLLQRIKEWAIRESIMITHR